jgi:hypothetical protein
VNEFFDLNKLLFRHPEATSLVRVAGESIADLEIQTGIYLPLISTWKLTKTTSL